MICYLASMAAASDPPAAGSLLEVALAEARTGLAEGGVPIGAAVFDREGSLVSAGHNLCLQEDDILLHAETVAIRRSGRLSVYGDKVLVTTLVPCWYCSGLIRYLGFGRVVVGDSTSFPSPTLAGCASPGSGSTSSTMPSARRSCSATSRSTPTSGTATRASQRHCSTTRRRRRTVADAAGLLDRRSNRYQHVLPLGGQSTMEEA